MRNMKGGLGGQSGINQPPLTAGTSG